MRLQSIYSIDALQRILDHWGVGKIWEVRYLGTIGPILQLDFADGTGIHSSGCWSLHFSHHDQFEAAVIVLPNRSRSIVITDAANIQYVWDLHTSAKLPASDQLQGYSKNDSK